MHRRSAVARIAALAGVLVAAAPLVAGAAAQDRAFVLATTTSTQDTGLLDSLLPLFERETGYRAKVIAVGTGAALEMARRGEADAVLVHAPEVERRYVESGDLVGGRRVMYNDFLFVGPEGDPAGVRRAADLRAVMAALAAGVARGATFISRGDGSGTEVRELALWRAAGIDPAAVRREETGQGMGATLDVAEQRRAYTLTDRATYLALRARLTLVPVYEGDSLLRNVYHAYVVSPARHAEVRPAAARAFVRFLVAPETQRRIGAFGRARFGRSLYVPDADE